MKQCRESVREKAYLTLSRPLLKYADAVWDPHHKVSIDKVEMCQRRAVRYVKNIYSRRSSVTTMLESLNWTSLEERRRKHRIIHFFKAENKYSGLIVPEYLTRSNRDNSKYIHPQCRTEIHKNSYFPRTVKDWNSLDCRNFPTVEAFKACLWK